MDGSIMERVCVCGHGFEAVALFFEFRKTFNLVHERRDLTVLFSRVQATLYKSVFVGPLVRPSVRRSRFRNNNFFVNFSALLPLPNHM